jgi:hypothetical protein
MGPRPVPVIEADPRPLKVRPEAPGGMVVPNQDQLVLEGATQRRAAERGRTTVAQLDGGPEGPAFDLLRQQVAPRQAAPAPQPPVAAAAAPAGTPAPVTAGTPSSLGNAASTILPPPASVAVASTVAAPAAAAAPALPGPVAGGRSHAQFAALNSEEAARAEWDRLVRRAPELAAFQPRITRLDREGQPTLWRLRVSGLADNSAARALCDAVRARGLPCVPSGGGT